MDSGCFNKLIKRLRHCAASLPDSRTGSNKRFSMEDIALSAFSVFFTQCPSFLSFQKAMEKSRGQSNARSLFQIDRIPSDNHIRQILDPIEPDNLFGLFDDLYEAFDGSGILKTMRAVHDTQLIALDGTWYFSSQSENIHCENCSCIHHSNGKETHFHSAITPVIVSPGHSQVVALRPEYIVPQDGHDKQDCEIAAAKRWISKSAENLANANHTFLGDDIYAHQPFCRQALMHGFHFLFTCKPSSHTHLTQWIGALEEERDIQVMCVRVKGKGNRWQSWEYRWVNGAPLVDSQEALKVNWLQLRILDHEGREIYRNSWITDWKLHEENVVAMAASARARWKIENENNNTLKTKGYNLEHNFGHGKKHLASVLLTMNILAFALHTWLEIADTSYRMVREAVATRKTFFEHIRALTHYMHFENWDRLMDFMMEGLEVGPYAPKK